MYVEFQVIVFYFRFLNIQFFDRMRFSERGVLDSNSSYVTGLLGGLNQYQVSIKLIKYVKRQVQCLVGSQYLVIVYYYYYYCQRYRYGYCYFCCYYYQISSQIELGLYFNLLVVYFWVRRLIFLNICFLFVKQDLL